VPAGTEILVTEAIQEVATRGDSILASTNGYL
jgi:hypothetical protein